MCSEVKTLKKIADDFIKLKHTEIDKLMTHEDKIEFINSLHTLNTHAAHILKSTIFEVA